MSITLIIGIVLLGVLLLVVEIFLLPGTTIFGFLGVLIMIAGTYLAYTQGTEGLGHIVLSATLLASVLFTWAGFKLIRSGKMTLKTEHVSQVNVFIEPPVEIGEQGKVISTLRPNGKVLFGNKKLEVHSRGDYLDVGTLVTVLRIEGNKIIVKPITQA